MDNVQYCDSYINIPWSQTYWLQKAVGLVVETCFLWGMDRPIEFSWVLNKRQDDG
jgi:hypothetical protein